LPGTIGVNDHIGASAVTPSGPGFNSKTHLTHERRIPATLFESQDI
jgi:hypothetical protein